MNDDQLTHDFESSSATDILKWTFETFQEDKVALSTSFGAEGCALIHMIVTMGYKPRIFTVDTGRNFQETYDVWDRLVKRYGIEIESYSPDPADLRQLLKGKGPNLFYESVENRSQCCFVRKVKPLKVALAGADAWLSALRRDQSEGRRNIEIVSRSEAHNVTKICPLANWLEENVWTYIRSNDVPYIKLYDQGFTTIGCAPCTRPVRPGEGKRSGRWWWESDDKKECGIHIEDGKVTPRRPAANFQI
ncbi:MAG: phosphoadenylyl-sulfate reductase [Lentisphaerae bacterium]|nr:phosphoadenylyl-sulfate reductase [Lentisphaerota bacterium]